MRRFFLLFIMVLLSAGAAHAQNDANMPPTCNPDFYETMSARAWMGGERDMEAAQTLIKGSTDNLSYSVLSLMCLSQRAGQLPDYAGQYSNSLISASSSSYLANFSGGTCASMSALWSLSKCENVKKDDFLSLKDLVTTDLRGCTGSREKWAAAYEATNSDYESPQSGDPEETFLDILAAKDECENVTVIPTGVEVIPDSGEPFPDAICASPKCWYDGTTCN